MKVLFNSKSFKAVASAVLLTCSVSVLVACNPGASAEIDLSPWNDPSGANSGLSTDISLSGPAQDGVPIQVSINVHNYGDETVTSININPIQAKIRGTNFEDLVTDGNNSDIKSLADGVSIAPGASATISFTWTPDLAQNISGIEAYVNPSGHIIDKDFSNNSTTIALTVGNPTVPPVVADPSCEGSGTQFDTCNTDALADIDLSPWNDPSGANLTDISLSSPPQDGVPIQVSVNVHNYGDETVTSISANPIQAKIRGTNFEDLVTDGNTSDIKSLADGVSIAPGASAAISFNWTPDLAQNISGIEAYVNPSGTIMEIDFSNNSTTRALTVAVAELSCEGFADPFDIPLTIKKRSKETISVIMQLTDANGNNVTDANGNNDTNAEVTTAPLINVLFNDEVSDSGATDDSNQFEYSAKDETWIFDLETKQFKSSGTYSVTVRSGDRDEYTVAKNGQCTQTFTRK